MTWMYWLILLIVSAFDSHERDWKFEANETLLRTLSGNKLLVDNINGSIQVTGYSGSEIRLTAQEHIRAQSPEAISEAKREVKLDISNQGGFVRLYVDGPFRASDGGMHFRGEDYYGYRVNFDYQIQVPYSTGLILKTVNNGDVIVKDVAGGYEIRNVNGKIEMEKIAGSGSVHTVNGPIKLSFSKNPTAASEVKTVNGSVDVYFQPGLSADLKMKTLNGQIFTDFDVTALAAPAGESDTRNGKFVYRGNRFTMGRAGRGGPELSFETLNGNIRLHSAGK